MLYGAGCQIEDEGCVCDSLAYVKTTTAATESSDTYRKARGRQLTDFEGKVGKREERLVARMG